jgi:uncharacterized cupredoxin-like copper-binding protein
MRIASLRPPPDMAVADSPTAMQKGDPMQPGKRKLIAAAAAGLLAPAGRLLAHGDATHPAKADRVHKEQKDWGIAGDADQARRRIIVGMSDTMRFRPERITVKLGETVRFVTRNDGKVMHEFVIGTQAANAKHAAMMLKFPGMEHDEPYMAHVPPGKTGQIVWTFNRSGQFQFACLIAGHYQAGMVGTITVSTS